MKWLAVILAAVLTAALVESANPPYKIKVVSKMKVLESEITLTAAEKTNSIVYLRKKFTNKLSPNTFIPPFCGNDDKELEPHIAINDMKAETAYNLIFANYEGMVYPLTVCPNTTYKQLLKHVATRLNLAKPDLKLSADKITFFGVVNEKDRVLNMQAAEVTNEVEFDPQYTYVIVVSRPPKRPTPPKLGQLTGVSVKLDIPTVGTSTIENVDMKEGTVGQLRSAIEAKFGADANHHKTMAICNNAGGEAEDKEKLSDIFATTKTLAPATITLVDWTAEERKEVKIAYCANSTFKQALSRALPSWKTAIDKGSMVSVYKILKTDDQAKTIGIFDTGPHIPLVNMIQTSAPTDNHIYYVMLEGSLLFSVSGKRFCLPDGHKTTMYDFRNALVKAVGRVKAWQYAFCANGLEMKPTDFLPPPTDPNVSICGDLTAAPAKSLLVMLGDNPKETYSYKFQQCANSKFSDLALRVRGLLELSNDDDVNISYLDEPHSTFVKLDDAGMGGDVLPFPHDYLVACVNRDQPKTHVIKQPWIQPFFSTFVPFTATLQGKVALTIHDIDPHMTVGDLRKQLIKDRTGEVSEDRILSFPFCVPSGLNYEETEMEEDRTFAYYGIAGGTNIIFKTEKAWFVDWTRAEKAGLAGEDRVVDVCKKSTYMQVAARAVDDRDHFLHTLKDINIVVEDKKPASDQERRKSFIVPPERQLEKDCLHQAGSDNKDASKIRLVPKRMAIVGVGDMLFPVSDPSSVKVGIIREYYVKQINQLAYWMALCADMQWAFWEAKEMDEERSFSHYGILPETWTFLGTPEKVEIKYNYGGQENTAQIEYCLRSTVDDLKYRLMMAVCPGCEVTIGPASPLDYPSFMIWSATGDTNFMPKALKADVTIVEKKELDLSAVAPQEKHKRIGQIVGEPPVSGGGGDAVPTITKTEAERLIDALQRPTNMADPYVIAFK